MHSSCSVSKNSIASMLFLSDKTCLQFVFPLSSGALVSCSGLRLQISDETSLAGYC